MIKLKNIDLSGIEIDEQGKKYLEECEELSEALENGTDKEVIEETWDVIQALLGLVLKLRNITAEELMEGYPDHLKKLKNRPRDKKEGEKHN